MAAKRKRHDNPGPRLARLDQAKFIREAREKLEALGHGAKARLIREAGVSNSTLCSTWRTGKQTDIDVILSVAAWLGMPLEAFIVRRRAPVAVRQVERGRMQRVDWSLFRACCSFLCGDDAAQLARRSGCSYDLCVRVLEGDQCGESKFEQFCRALKLPPRTFAQS